MQKEDPETKEILDHFENSFIHMPKSNVVFCIFFLSFGFSLINITMNWEQLIGPRGSSTFYEHQLTGTFWSTSVGAFAFVASFFITGIWTKLLRGFAMILFAYPLCYESFALLVVNDGISISNFRKVVPLIGAAFCVICYFLYSSLRKQELLKISRILKDIAKEYEDEM